MGSVTPYVIAGEGYVRVEVNWQDFPSAKKCWIYRRLEPPGSTLLMLRDGNATRMSNGIAVAFDHEAPLDVPIIYRSVIALNANGDFEDGVTEWQDSSNNGTVGTVAQSTDYYVVGEGLASMVLTPSGAATSKAVSEFVPATAGVTYTISGRLMVPDYWSGGIGVQLQWYNAGVANGTVGAANDFAPFPGEWGSYGFSATAPAGTTHVRLVAAITGTPPASLKLYTDEIYLTTSGTSVDAALPVVVPSAGGGWWTDPLHPATKTRLLVDLTNASTCAVPTGIVYLGVSEENLPADSTALEINDAEYPIATWSRRKSTRQSVRVGTQTLADLERVRALHAPGAPLFFHLNGAYAEPDQYQLHGDLAIGRVHGDQKVPWRVVVSSFTRTLAPVGPAEGTLGSRYMDFTKFSSFQAAEASSGGAYDRYGRTVSNGWGTSTSGLATTTSGGAASEYSTNGTQGLVAVAALSSLRLVLYPVSLADVLSRIKLVGFTPTGGNPEHHIYARYVNSTNYVRARVFRVAAGGMTVAVSQVVAGVETVSGFITVPGAANNSTVQAEFVALGANLSATVWVDGTAKPQTPTVTLGSITMLSAGQAGPGVLLPGAVSNPLPLTVTVDDYAITNLAGGNTWLDGLQGELVA